MNPKEIGTNELSARVAAELLRGVGTGTYGDQPYIIDLFPGIGKVVYFLSGAYRRRDYTIADDLAIALGGEEAVSSRTEYLPEFDARFEENGGTTWKGLLFRAGKFLERIVEGAPLEITSDQIDAIIEHFPAEGVPLLVDHNWDSAMTLPLRESGARVVRVWKEKGVELHGEVRAPSWLEDAFGNIARKVSVGLSRAFDRLEELSIVTSPRIADAALYGAFARSTAFSAFADRHPAEAQTIAQLAKEETPAPDPKPPLMNEQELQAAQAYFRANPEAARAAGLDPAKFAAPAPAPAPAATTYASTIASASPTDQETRLTELERSILSRFQAEDDRADALTLYETGLREGRIDPAEREAFVHRFEDARFADRARFADGLQTPSVDRLKAEIAARPVRRLFGGNRIASQDPALDVPGGTALTVSPYKPEDFSAAGLGKPKVNP